MTVMLGVIGALTAYLVTRRLAADSIPTFPLRRLNYRGIDVPTGSGLVVLAGMLAGSGVFAGLRALARTSRHLDGASDAALVMLAAAFGFGLLGLWDDLAGNASERGWRAHLRALAHGRGTTGAIKLAGGAAFALLLAGLRGDGALRTVIDAAVIALTANLFNLLDLRPGRAAKTFLAAAVPLLIVGGTHHAPLAAAVGAVVAFLPYDLRERAMLGDAGANALGALIGVTANAAAGPNVRLGLLIALIALHILGARPGLSRLIDATPPLRKLDRAGRAPE